ncbi:sucrase ferredoxin [Corynebacterium sp. CCM 9185]|uniref:Sucrase ferredoxin n=1 Tax=Corynebacterium marambiense TaxID=2765364 RepID=A0ABS0VRK3_9CORY|nr:sucrase ferredoxin [Corynebacterium marambiense]MBI8999401.1 sucrase ferredoxin [Corynebacterium marambiense]MCK7662239.1 sucrase ferredoxin [Corynebacterium marambiense]
MSSRTDSGRPPRCSDDHREPLPGTAKKGTTYLIVEHAHGWGRDVLDGDALGAELTGRIRELVDSAGAAFHLIRRPGRDTREGAPVRAYLIFTSSPDPDAPPPTIEAYDLPGGMEDIFALDLSGPELNTALGARRVPHPLVLVCTHGKRDLCCAVKGRPMASAMRAAASSMETLLRRRNGDPCAVGGAEQAAGINDTVDVVWESSHTGGHRFAPSMILLPWGYSYGRMSTDQGMAMLATLARGELPLPGLRGRGCYDGPGQAAEVHVAAELSAKGYPVAPGELVVSAVEDPAGTDTVRRTVARPGGGRWSVELRHRELPPVLKSCGKEPAAADTWCVIGFRSLDPGE